MRFSFAPAAFLFAVALGGAPLAVAQAQTSGQHSYQIAPATSGVTAKVRFMALSSKTVTFSTLSGEIAITPSDLSEITLDVTIDASEMAAKEAYILEALKGDKFFDVANYPDLHFVGQSLTMDSATRGVIDGQLTARGVTLPQQLKIKFSKAPATTNGSDSFTVTGEVKIDRRDYGMTAYPLIVGNKVTIKITAEVVPQTED